MLELKNINKIYETKSNTKVDALTDVNISFRKCEFVSILGPSGCGKTTLLNLVGGLDRATSGDIVVDGKSTKDFVARDWDSYRNHKIGFVFQSYNLIPHQTVLENVILALTLSGENPKTCKHTAMKALEKVGLANHLRKRSNELSGGEMQRVAIARAIVNNPEIILADEPTGALDSKTSVQIMDLLKEISKDRLVIMVTHNDALANSYSTRIVKLFDSKIIYDSNPYDATEDVKKLNSEKNAENQQLKAEQLKNKDKKGKNNNKTQKIKAEKQQIEKEDKESKKEKKEKKTSMSFFVALSLSLKNLMTKKARTTMMAIASSIGIVGLALVLALFNGLNIFLDKVQYETLSAYPMFVTTWTNDTSEYLSIIMDKDNYLSNPEKKDNIFVSHLVTKLNETNIKNVITPEYQQYVNNAPKELYRDISYTFGTKMNVFKREVELQTNTVYKNIVAKNVSIPAESYFKQLVGDEDFILSQYDLVAGHYPRSKEDLVLILDKNNQITDSMLIAFLMDVNAATKNEKGEFIVNQYKYSEFLPQPDGKPSKYGSFSLAKNDGIFVSDSENPGFYNKNICSLEEHLGDTYDERSASAMIDGIKQVVGNNLPVCYNGTKEAIVPLNIVGILRLKEEITTGAMGVFPIGYTEELGDYIVEQAEKSNIVKSQMKEFEKLHDNNDQTKCYNVLLNSDKSKSEITADWQYKDALKSFGYSDNPTKIEFYATSFENKLKLKEYLAKYNNLENVKNDDSKKIYVTDMVATVIDVLKIFINTIVAILLSLTAISLVVAAIMIAIITYVSVIERTREIGILRSIGARKIDITSVFNAETIIIGLLSGILGIIFAVIMQFPLNAILYSFTGIHHLASLAPFHGLILVIVSVVITLLSGAIPAILAAKRDPVKALRSE